MSRERQLGLLVNLGRLQAQERIHKQLFDPLDYEGIEQLYLAAFGDEKLARKAKAQSLLAYVRLECEKGTADARRNSKRR